jgi:hypothetical protein
VVRTIAKHRRESFESIAAATTANALAFFGFARDGHELNS